MPLREQDRTRWDTGLIAEGVTILQAALARDRLGEYQAQARMIPSNYRLARWVTAAEATRPTAGRRRCATRPRRAGSSHGW